MAQTSHQVWTSDFRDRGTEGSLLAVTELKDCYVGDKEVGLLGGQVAVNNKYKYLCIEY